MLLVCYQNEGFGFSMKMIQMSYLSKIAYFRKKQHETMRYKDIAS